MKKILVLFLTLILAVSSFAATFTAAQAGNWNASATWGNAGAPAVEGTDYPGNGDTADLNGFVVTMNITTLPASGTLTLLRSGATNNSAGQITVALDTLGSCAINCTTIQAGTKNTGIVNISGTTSNTLTITSSGGITGGTGSSAYGVYHNSTGTVVIVGPATGGSSTTTHGVRNNTTGAVTITGLATGGSFAGACGVYNGTNGTVTITGNIVGGGGSGAYGFQNGGATAVVVITGNLTGGTAAGAFGCVNTGNSTSVTLNSCNMINSTYAIAYSGYPPTWNVTSANYIQWGTVKFRMSSSRAFRRNTL